MLAFQARALLPLLRTNLKRALTQHQGVVLVPDDHTHPNTLIPLTNLIPVRLRATARIRRVTDLAVASAIVAANVSAVAVVRTEGENIDARASVVANHANAVAPREPPRGTNDTAPLTPSWPRPRM